MNTLRQNFIFILPILAFVIYSYLWQGIDMTATDTAAYLEVSQDISDGELNQLHDRTPGFPLLLLMTGSSIHPSSLLLYIQLLMYTLSVSALSWMLNKFRVSIKFILIFSALALLPYNIAIATSATTEVLTSFLLVFAILFLFLWFTKERFSYLSLSAILFGYAAITRPTYQLIVFIFIFVFVISLPYLKEYKQKFFYSIVALSISSLLLIGPLLYSNYTKFNFVGLTPLIGFNLCTKTVPVLERLPDEYAEVRDILIKYRNENLIKKNSSHTAFMYIWDAIPELKEATNLDTTALSNYMKNLNVLLIKKAPLNYLKGVGDATVSFWFPNISKSSFFESKTLQLLFTLIHFLVIGLFFLLLIFMLGLKFVSMFFNLKYKIFNKEDELFFIVFSLLVIIIFYTMLISTAIEMGNARYRTPTDLYILFLIFYTFSFIKEKIEKYNNNVSIGTK